MRIDPRGEIVEHLSQIWYFDGLPSHSIDQVGLAGRCIRHIVGQSSALRSLATLSSKKDSR
jgi:hypothetical protein